MKGIEYISVNNYEEYPDIWEIDYDAGTAKLMEEGPEWFVKVRKYRGDVETYLEDKGFSKVKENMDWSFEFSK